MANLYVRSTDGSDADNGSTWALAKATLSGASAIDAAGDAIYVSQVHAESSGSAQTIALAGTAASPVRVICGNDGAAPPTAVDTSGVITTTGNFAISITGSAYISGLTFAAGTGASGGSASLSLNASANHFQTFENCSFRLNTSGSSQALNPTSAVASAGQSLTRWVDCSVRFGHAAHAIQINRGIFEWAGGSLLSGGTSPTTLLNLSGTSNYAGIAKISGVDLSNASSAINLVTGQTPGQVVIRNSKLPASWSGSLFTGTFSPGLRVEMHNCDSADTNYRLWVEDYAGSIKSETTIVKSSGASDGTTGLSWKMASSANAKYPLIPLKSPEIVKWNETVGSAITATIEVVTDNVTLTDDDCWVEVQYLGTSGFPIGSFVSDVKADVLATAASQSSSTETWTTTGLTTPVKQKLSVTFTPQEKGFLHAVVHLAKASTTVYVDPLLTIT